MGCCSSKTAEPTDPEAYELPDPFVYNLDDYANSDEDLTPIELEARLGEAIGQDRSDANHYVNYCLHLMEHKPDQVDTIRQYLDGAIQVDRMNIRGYSAYAFFLMRIGDKEGAAQKYKDGFNVVGSKATLSEEDIDFLLTYASFCRKELDLPERAADCFKRAVISAPNQISVKGNYGLYLAYGKQDPDAAERYLQDAADSGQPHWQRAYGRFLAEVRGDKNAARGYCPDMDVE